MHAAAGVQLARLALGRGAMLYDPARIAAPGPELFDRAHWRRLGALVERPGGRGSISYIQHQHCDWVLRRYLRGGLPARFARERYLYLGEARTRSFRELRLLASLAGLGLPVPAPVAACYRRRGLGYVAELLTARLPDAASLADAVLAGEAAAIDWGAIGSCLRRFHDAGAEHADLNAGNILLGAGGRVWLLDFDRGRLRRPGAWQAGVLARLERSLAKITSGSNQDWRAGFAALRAAHG